MKGNHSQSLEVSGVLELFPSNRCGVWRAAAAEVAVVVAPPHPPPRRSNAP